MDKKFTPNLSLATQGSCLKKGLGKIGTRKNNETGEITSAYVPITTKGAGDTTVFKFMKQYEKSFPSTKQHKVSFLSGKEEEAFFNENKAYDKTIKVRVLDYDRTADEHAFAMFENNSMIQFLNIVNGIDMEYDLGDGKTYWDELNIPKGEYVKVAEWIRDNLQPSPIDIEIFDKELKLLAMGQPTMAEQEIYLANKAK